jgi:hypothetical protein
MPSQVQRLNELDKIWGDVPRNQRYKLDGVRYVQLKGGKLITLEQYNEETGNKSDESGETDVSESPTGT